MELKNNKTLRCAIYTRKSSEEGLEQDFNSLDAQREACEAYIKSQQHEGWTLVEKQYNDGGFSGGTLERPALKKLLTDIEAGKVDIVVVYKVDRLTRSLMDFSKIVERFDSHETSFVSITQQFSTTSSMGRLTLNILLSFAQFEREVTGERIRDKIAASKKKGMWVGGSPPLGYEAIDKKLVIDKKHSDKIGLIYEKYLEFKNIIALKTYLDKTDIRTKSGKPFYKGHLYRILSNQVYIGKIAHKENVYDGLHEPIISEELFNEVQKISTRNRIEVKTAEGSKNPSLLSGKIFDDKGNYMSPSHSNTRNRKYRYYVSQALIKGQKSEAGSVSKIPAGEIEKLVVKEIKIYLFDHKNIQELLKDCNIHKQKDLLSELNPKVDNLFIRTALNKITIAKDKIEIVICKNQLLKLFEAIYYKKTFPEEIKQKTNTPITITKNINISSTAKNGSVLIISQQEKNEINLNSQLIKAVAKSYYWNNLILEGKVKNTIELQNLEGLKTDNYIGRIIRLRFLAPEITEAILNGTQPKDLTVQELFKIRTLDWEEQRSLLRV